MSLKFNYKLNKMFFFIFYIVVIGNYSCFSSDEVEDAEDKKHRLVKYAQVNPIISGVRFRNEDMTATVTFKKLGNYEHACVVFEYLERSKYLYETVHLSADGEPDGCYGYGTKARIGKHSARDIMTKFVKDYKDGEEGVIEISPEYKKYVTFIVSKRFKQRVEQGMEEDNRTVKFSFVGDLWSRGNYNCCSYAHKILGYCGLNIEFNNILKSDANFKIALRNFASTNGGISKVHV